MTTVLSLPQATLLVLGSKAVWSFENLMVYISLLIYHNFQSAFYCSKNCQQEVMVWCHDSNWESKILHCSSNCNIYFKGMEILLYQHDVDRLYKMFNNDSSSYLKVYRHTIDTRGAIFSHFMKMLAN